MSRHSDLLERLVARGFRLWVDGTALKVHPADRLTTDDCSELSQGKPELIRLLCRRVVGGWLCAHCGATIADYIEEGDLLFTSFPHDLSLDEKTESVICFHCHQPQPEGTPSGLWKGVLAEFCGPL